MKKIALAAALAASFSLAHADVVTFDGVDPHYAIPAGYGGVDWSHFYTVDGLDSFHVQSGYHNAVVSGTDVAFNSGGGPASITAADSHGFNLGDGFFTAAWNDGLQVTATATFEDRSTATKTFTLTTGGPVDEVFGWTHLASVRFTSAGGVKHAGFSGQGTQFGLDNLNVSVVPEPASGALLLAGLAALALRARRHRRAG